MSALISPNKITLEMLKKFFESVGCMVHPVSGWELEIRVLHLGIASEHCICVKFIPTQHRIMLENNYKYTINYSDSIFKECMQLNLVYDLIKIVFQEVSDESDCNFRVVASYPINYSEGFYPNQVIADLSSFDNILDNLSYDLDSLLLEEKCEKSYKCDDDDIPDDIPF